VAATFAGPVGVAHAGSGSVPAAFTQTASSQHHPAKHHSSKDSAAEVEDEHLPVAIHVGASRVDLPLWLELDEPSTSVDVTLDRSSSGDCLSETTLTNSRPDTEFKGNVTLAARDVKSWGNYEWEITPEDGDPYTVDAKVRAHSQLGMKAERDGNRVKITGSLRAYHSVLDTYKPWKGRRILVERWDDGEWTTVRTLTTDKSGDVEATIKLSWTVGLRLTANTSSRIWGAQSNEVVL
jgi:hypothetical protein